MPASVALSYRWHTAVMVTCEFRNVGILSQIYIAGHTRGFHNKNVLNKAYGKSAQVNICLIHFLFKIA